MAEPASRTSQDGHAEDIGRLLTLRDELAHEVYEQLSHGVDGAWELVEDLLSLERHLESVAPSQYRRRSPRWARQEARMLHAPGSLSGPGSCSRCSGAHQEVA